MVSCRSLHRNISHIIHIHSHIYIYIHTYIYISEPNHSAAITELLNYVAGSDETFMTYSAYNVRLCLFCYGEDRSFSQITTDCARITDEAIAAGLAKTRDFRLDGNVDPDYHPIENPRAARNNIAGLQDAIDLISTKTNGLGWLNTSVNPRPAAHTISESAYACEQHQIYLGMIAQYYDQRTETELIRIQNSNGTFTAVIDIMERVMRLGGAVMSTIFEGTSRFSN